MASSSRRCLPRISIMIKAVIFDLNGVFIHSPKLSDRFEKDFRVPIADFLPKLSEIMAKVRTPNAGSAYSYWKPVLAQWGITMDETEFWDYWFKAETPSQEMIALAQELKAKGVKVITLSNNFKERSEFYGHYPWMHEAVDRAYFSWQTGLVKPDTKAWKLVLADFNLAPAEAIYFDDQEKNLAAAESLGIKAFMYASPEATQEVISKYVSI